MEIENENKEAAKEPDMNLPEKDNENDSDYDGEPIGKDEFGNLLYVVEKILDKRKHKGQWKYKVKWLGWDNPEDLTWEPLSNLHIVKEMVKEFDEEYERKRSK